MFRIGINYYIRSRIYILPFSCSKVENIGKFNTPFTIESIPVCDTSPNFGYQTIKNDKKYHNLSAYH